MTSSTQFHNEPLKIDQSLFFKALKTLAEMVTDNGFDISKYDWFKCALNPTVQTRKQFAEFMDEIKENQWTARAQVKPSKKKGKKKRSRQDSDDDQEFEIETKESSPLEQVISKLWNFFDQDLHMTLDGLRGTKCFILFSLGASVDAESARTLQDFVKLASDTDIIVISHEGFTTYALNNSFLPTVRKFTFRELYTVNPTRHKIYSCPHILLDEKQKSEKMSDLNVEDITQLPRLLIDDVQKIYNNFPGNSLIKIMHHSGEPPIRGVY